MSDIAFPPVAEQQLAVVQNELLQGAMEPVDIAGMIRNSGETVGSECAWREVGAKALLLAARSREYVVELMSGCPALVTRLDPPAKPVKNGPYTMLPIERCETELEDLIVIGRQTVFRGLCRVTKRLDVSGRGYSPGPVDSLTFIR